MLVGILSRENDHDNQLVGILVFEGVLSALVLFDERQDFFIPVD
jgi:hypothetical protein